MSDPNTPLPSPARPVLLSMMWWLYVAALGLGNLVLAYGLSQQNSSPAEPLVAAGCFLAIACCGFLAAGGIVLAGGTPFARTSGMLAIGLGVMQLVAGIRYWLIADGLPFVSMQGDAGRILSATGAGFVMGLMVAVPAGLYAWLGSHRVGVKIVRVGFGLSLCLAGLTIALADPL